MGRIFLNSCIKYANFSASSSSNKWTLHRSITQRVNHQWTLIYRSVSSISRVSCTWKRKCKLFPSLSQEHVPFWHLPLVNEGNCTRRKEWLSSFTRKRRDTFVQFVHRQLCNSKQKDLLIKDGSFSFTLSRFISIHTWKFQTEKLICEHLEYHASPLCSILNYIPRLYSTSKFQS